eukprot:scaffold7362_cov32-Phaeocystis_antarctica.AAC.2
MQLYRPARTQQGRRSAVGNWAFHTHEHVQNLRVDRPLTRSRVARPAIHHDTQTSACEQRAACGAHHASATAVPRCTAREAPTGGACTVTPSGVTQGEGREEEAEEGSGSQGLWC